MSSWFGFTAVSEALQRRFARFALQKSLGQFLEYKLALDQVNITSGGRFELTELELDVKALDKYLCGTPLEVAYGYVRSITGRIPYARLLSEGCEVAIDGVILFLRPRTAEDQASQMRADPAASVMSVFDDLSEAVDEIGEELARDMAEEQDPAGGSEAPEEGMQSLAYAAKRVMSQVEVKITDLQIRLIVPAAPSADVDSSQDDGQCIMLCVNIDSAEINDTTSDAAAVSRATSTASSQGARPSAAAFDATTAPTSTKELRLQGYSVTLEYGEEEASGQNPGDLKVARRVPIVSSVTPALPDLMTIKLQHLLQPGVPKMEATIFVHSLFAALSPKIVQDLLHVASCFSGSDLQARTAATPPASEESDAEAKTWKISATVVRSNAVLVYEPSPLDDAHVISWLEAQRTMADHFAERTHLEERLLTSPVTAALRRRHLNLGVSHLRATASSASSDTHLQLRDVALIECEWEQEAPVLYDLLQLEPQAASTASNDASTASDDGVHVCLSGDPAAASTVHVTFHRPLRIAADVSVLDRLYPYLHSEEDLPEDTAESADSAAQPAVSSSSPSAALHSVFLQVDAQQVILAMPVQVARSVWPVRAQDPTGWRLRPRFRPCKLDCELEVVSLRVSLGGDPPGADPALPTPLLAPSLGVELLCAKATLSIGGASVTAPLVVLRGRTESRAAIRVALRRDSPTGTTPAGLPWVTVPTPSGDARQQENMDRAELSAWLKTCSAAAGIALTVDAHTIQADLPKAETELLVQLLMELAEWDPWAPPVPDAGHADTDAIGKDDLASSRYETSEATATSYTDTEASRSRRQTHAHPYASQGGLGTKTGADAMGAPCHKAAVDVRSHRVLLSLHEASTAVGIEETTHFELELGDAIVGVVQGLNGTAQRCLALRGQRAALQQRDPSLELAPPPARSVTRAILVGDDSGQGTAGVPTADMAETLAAAASEGASLPPDDAFALAVVMSPASEYALSTISVVMDLADICAHYFEDPRGLWLTRSLKLLSFPDPPDWPKPATKAAPSILRLTVHFRRCAALFEPLSKPLATKALLPSAHVSSNIVSGTPVTVLAFGFDNLNLLLVDDRAKLRPGRTWHAQGWRSVASARDMRLQLTLSDDPLATALSLTVTNRALELTTCADSFATLLLLGDVLADDSIPAGAGLPPTPTGAGAGRADRETLFSRPAGGGARRGPSLPSAASSHSTARATSRTASRTLLQTAATPTLTGGEMAALSSATLAAVTATGVARLTPAALAALEIQLQNADLGTSEGEADVATFGEGSTGSVPDGRGADLSGGDEEEFLSADEGTDEDDVDTPASGSKPTPFGRLRSEGAASASEASGAVSQGTGADSHGDSFVDTPVAPQSPSVSRAMSEALNMSQREPTPLASPDLVADGALSFEEDYFETATVGVRPAWHAVKAGTSSEGRGKSQATSTTPRATSRSSDLPARVQAVASVDFADDFADSLAESLQDSSRASPVDSTLGMGLAESVYEEEAVIDDMETSVFSPAAPQPVGVPSGAGTAHRLRSDASSASGMSGRQGAGRVEYCNRDGCQRLQLVLNPDHFQPPAPGHSDDLLPHPFLPKVPAQRVELKRMSLTWHMLGGRDWRIPADDDAPEGEREPRRRGQYGVTVQVSGLSLVRETYAKEEAYRSRLLMLVRQVEILDNVPESYVRVMLSDYTSEALPRERNSNMLRLEMMQLVAPRAEGELRTHLDTILQVRLLPLRINLDQDTLNFVIRFLTHTPGTSESGIEEGWEDVVYPPPDEVALNRARAAAHARTKAQQHPSSTGSTPQRGTADIGNLLDALAEEQGVATPLETTGATEGPVRDTSPPTAESVTTTISTHDDWRSTHPDDDEANGQGTTFETAAHHPHEQPTGDGVSSDAAAAASPEGRDSTSGTFFKLVDIGQVVLRVDYEPKRLSYGDLLFSGDLEQLAGLIKLENAHVILAPAVVKGLHGWPTMGKAVVDAWMLTISRSQVQIFLTGIPVGSNVASVLQASTGLVHQPLQQYPYVLQGVRDGLFNSLQTTSVEMCNVGTTFLFAVQAALELAHHVTPSGARESQLTQRQPQRSRMAQQPLNVTDGLVKGYHALLDAVHRGYQDVTVRPVERAGGTVSAGVLAEMLGAVPGAGLQPLIGICEAAALSLQGLRNAIRPSSRLELQQKYKSAAAATVAAKASGAASGPD